MEVCKKLTKFYHDQIVKKSKDTIFIISIDRRRKTRRNKFDLVKKNEEFEMNTRDTPKEIVISRGKLGGRLLFRRGSLPEFQEASSPTRRNAQKTNLSADKIIRFPRGPTLSLDTPEVFQKAASHFPTVDFPPRSHHDCERVHVHYFYHDLPR